MQKTVPKPICSETRRRNAQVRVMGGQQWQSLLMVLLMLFTPLAALPVFGSDPNEPDGDKDDDNDGYDANRDGEISQEERYTNLEEYYNNTDSKDPDTDGGGAWDGWEIYYGFNPRSASDDQADSDSDGLVNEWEFLWDIDPYVADSDQDGMPDGWEHNYSFPAGGCGLDPSDFSDQHGDADNDGSDNLREYNEDTDPCDDDSDDDGDPDGGDPPPLPPGEENGTKPDTGRTDGEVTIYEIFNPPLMSLKRWYAQDALYYDSSLPDPYSMYIYDRNKVEIEPTGTTDYTHVFEGWLWMGVTLSTELYTPIPSVAPDADVIDYDSNATGVDVSFYKDGADNYFIRGNQDVVIDLRYRMGTNGSYFNRPVSETLTLDDLPPESIRPIFGQSEVEEKVKQFLQMKNGTEPANPPLYWLWPENGSRETNMAKIVTNLTWYFSNFREGDGDVPDPEPPWDVYQSICINGIGACRHRSFGFFVTANVMGLPTRYVSNEAHAFVEVYIPEDNLTFSASHWKRINLGGTGSSTTLDRPDSDGEGDDFDFDENDPGDIDNMTGERVTVVLEGVSPSEADKGTQFRLWGYVEDRNGTRLPGFGVGGGMWDEPHATPAFEIGTGSTNATGDFDFNASGFLGAIPGENEIYAAVYQSGYLGVDGPELVEVYTDTNLTVDAPASVGKGQELVVSGSLLDIGGVAAPGETLAFEVWEPAWGGSKPGTIRCNPTGWQRYRCDEMGTTQTDEFGNFVVNWTVPETGQPTASNDYHIEVLFPGSTYRYTTIETTDLRILESSVELDAWLDPETVLINDPFWVNGTIIEAAIDNGNISIELDGSVIASDAVEDSNWSFSVTAPSNLPAGNYTVLVIFYPDDPETSTLPEERVSLTLTLRGTSTLALTGEEYFARNANASLTGRLLDHLGQPLAERTVSLAWEGVAAGDRPTAPDGDFGLNHFLPLEHPLGAAQWSANFAGDFLHEASNSTRNVVVVMQPQIEFSVAGRHFYPGDSFWINGTLAMDNGTSLAGSLVLLIDGVFVTTFATNGSFSFFHTPDVSYLDVGSHQLELRYGGDELVLDASTSRTVFLHRQVVLTLEGQQVLRGEVITLAGSAHDHGSMPVGGIEIEFDWPATTSDPDPSITGGSGGFSSGYSVPQAQLLGYAEVAASFDNTTQPYYDSANTSAVFTVVSELTIQLSDQESYRGEPVWFNGTLLDDRGQPVPELALNLFWADGYLTNFESDAEGNFSVACDAAWSCADPAHSLGPVEVRLDFGGFGWYLPAERVATWTVWGRALVTIDEFAPVVIAGSNVTYSGNVVDDLGQSLDRTLQVRWNDITRTTVDAVNGEFAGSFALEAFAPVGNFTLALASDDQNWLRGSSDTATVTVQRYTVLELEWGPALRNISTAVQGSLLDSSGAGLEGELVSYSFDGTAVGEALTGADGALQFELPVPATTELGMHTLSASFTGSYFYLPSSIEVQGSVVAATILDVSPQQLQRAASFSLEAVLRDDTGLPLEGEAVNLSLAGQLHLLQTGPDGRVTFTHEQLPAIWPLGPLDAIWSYAGREWYLPSETVQELVVVAPTTLQLLVAEAVLAGQSYSVAGNIEDDLGQPLINAEVILFAGGFHLATVQSDTAGSFSWEWAVPLEQVPGPLQLSAQYPGAGYRLAGNASQQVSTYHTTSLLLEPASGVLNYTANVTGRVIDGAGRGVEGLVVTVALDDGTSSTVISTANGQFAAGLLPSFALGVGEHNLTATVLGSSYYYGSTTSGSLLAKGGTITRLELPAALEAGVTFTGRATLMLEDGTPLAGMPLLVRLEPTGVTMLAITDDNGSATFSAEFAGNTTHAMLIRVTFDGDELYLENSVEEAILFRPPPEIPNYLLWLLVAATVAATGGAAYGYRWYSTRHLRAIRQVLTITATELEANLDFRDAIISSYREMCRVLQGHGYLRSRFETVREFQQALRQAMPLDQDSLSRLTRLYEIADYALPDPGEQARSEAIASLRVVLESLEAMLHAPT